MKVAVTDREVISGGIVEEAQFTVEPSAHMMAVLSGLYKNPREAIMREYLSNVNDAYVALFKSNPNAKFIKPILRLPTRLSPTLEFQDFGIGMDRAGAKVFRTYGASTKNDNNDEVGGFGLGCKTAFCYNDGSAWFVTTVKNGVRHKYMLFVGENGIPNMNLILTEDTKDHSGVTISIPIKAEDIIAIHDAARKFLPYFPLEITIENLEGKITKPEYLYQGTDWGFVGGSTYSYNYTSTVIIGNVPYDVDFEERKGYSADKTQNISNEELFTRNEWEIWLPIGSVDIVPSRDNLKMTERTVKAIREKLNTVRKEFTTQVTNAVENASCEWDAIVHYQRITRSIRGLSKTPLNLKWKGQDVSLDKIERTSRDAKMNLGLDSIALYKMDGNVATPTVTSDTTVISLPVSEVESLVYIVINDSSTSGTNVVRGLMRQKFVNVTNGGRTARWGHKAGQVYLVTTKATKKKISEWFGGIPLNLIQTVSELKGTVPVVKGEITANIYKFDGKRHFVSRVRIPEGEDKFYYLPVERKGRDNKVGYYEGINPDGWRSHSGDVVVPLMAMAQTLNLFASAPLYGVLADDIADLDDSWVNLLDGITDAIIAKIGTCKTELATLRSNIGAMTHKKVGFIQNNAKVIAPELCADIVKIGESQKKYSNFTILLDNHLKFLGLKNTKKIQRVLTEADKSAENLNLEKRAEQLFAKYPVLNVVFEVSQSNNTYYYGVSGKDSSIGQIVTKNLQLILDNEK